MSADCVTSNLPLAIVGIAADLPSGGYSDNNLDHAAFFDFLLGGHESYERIPLERFKVDILRGSQPGRIVAELGSFLKDTELFDHLEFGITYKDARSMSLSTRKLLELSFLALLDSGMHYRGRNIGCFTSGITHDTHALGNMDEFEARGSFAGIPTQIANKISYHLDLVGPSIPLDTACSSTLSAMHLAVQSIRAGDCEAALVGGCQLNHRFLDFVQYTQGGVLAPGGKCKPFDASADGFSRGEAAVVVVIKPLTDALRDRDKIYATILGTGINSTGSVAPANAPVASAQEDAMRRAYARACREPSDACFVEMHATGTASGDPTEANWVGKAFQRRAGDSSPLLVGSVKGNIGHTEITAFLASLCKVIGIFEHKIIPPNVNLRQLNPAIHWDEYNLKVPIVSTSLPTHTGLKALISIASSGIGGSNGHCVVEEPPARSVMSRLTSLMSGPLLFVVGALSPRAATSLCASFSSLLKEHPDEAASLSSLLGRRVRQMTWRSFAILDPKADVKVEFTPPALSSRSKPTLVFVFSGQGPQHIEMGRQLFRDFAVFRECVLAMDAIYARIIGVSLITSMGLFDTLQSHHEIPETWPINITLPSIAIIQVALVDLLRSLGILPDVVIGHSAGETAMLYACGALSKEAAIEIAIARGQALQQIESPETTMAAVSCDTATAEMLIAEVRARHSNGVLEIACYNADLAITVAGNTALIDDLVEMCKSRGVAAQKLRTNVAVHSSIMDGCQSDLCSKIQDVFDRHKLHALQSPTIPTYSCTTGNRLHNEVLDVDYLWRNSRQPVLFKGCVESLTKDYADRQLAVVEIGPHPVLSGYLSSLLPASSTIVAPMRRTKAPADYHERTILLRAIGGLVNCGYNGVDFFELNGKADHLVSLPIPPYPFSRKAIPIISQYTGQQHVLSDWKGPLNFSRLRMNAATHPDLAEHIIKSEPIVPATGFLEMALEFGANVLWNVKFHAFLSLSQEEPRPVRVSLQGTHWSVSSERIEDNLSAKAHKLHAEGELLLERVSHLPPSIDILAVKARCESINTHGIYDDLSYFAAYGPSFQCIKSFHRGSSEFLVEVDSRRSSLMSYRRHYRLDPAIMDACLHILVHPLITGTTDKSVYYLPSRCDRFFLYNDATAFTERLFAYGSNCIWTPDELSYDILVVNSNNVPICAFRGLTVSAHVHARDVAARLDMSYIPIGSIPTHLLDGTDTDISKVGLSIKDIFDDALFLRHRAGDEITDLLDTLKDVDYSKITSVWLFTVSGYSAGISRGFSRSLRREVPVVVRLVETRIECPLSLEKVIAAQLIAAGVNDEEVIIDASGSILAPRLRSVETSDTDPSGSTVSVHVSPDRISSPNSQSPHIAVRPDQVYRQSGLEGIFCFTGLTSRGDRVVCIAGNLELPDGTASVPEDYILPIPQGNGTPLDQIAKYALAAMSLSLAHTGENSSLVGMSILLTHADTSIASRIQEILSYYHVEFCEVDSEAPLSDILHLHPTAFDIVLTGYNDPTKIAFLRSLYPLASFFPWNSQFEGLPALLRQQYQRKAAMENFTKWIPAGSLLSNGHDVGSAAPQIDERAEVLSSASTTFKAHASYVLIGGIGSLGLHIAVWMYHNGARHIVLTSRSGRETLTNARNIHSLRVLQYLENLHDLNLVLSPCDAANKNETRNLIASLHVPVAGCMLLSAVLDDKPLLSQTYDSFFRVFASKVGAYHALREALDINRLDFLVAFSSISGLFGNAGQTNYASANTALEFLISQHDNAFCLVTPMILDTSIAFGDPSKGNARNAKVQHIAAWGVSCRDVCGYIADGLRQLRTKPFTLYVPEMDWRTVQDRLGTSSFFAHLVPEESLTLSNDTQVESSADSVLRILLQVLEIPSDEFSSEIPLTAYGLDSLSAQRIVAMIHPFVRVTHLQILSDMSFDDIMTRISATRPVDETDLSKPVFVDWVNSKTPIVQLRGGEGTPIFLIPGASGTPEVFIDIAQRSTTPVYGVNIIPDSPDTLPELAEYLRAHIKQVQPHGPYRIGGFCVGTTVALLLVERFLRAGDELGQVALIEGFPMFFTSPVWELDQETVEGQCLSKSLEQRTLDFLITMYATEPVASDGFDYRGLAERSSRAIRGEIANPFVAYKLENSRRSARAHAHFVSGFVDPLQAFDPRLVREGMIKWLSTFKNPMTIYIGDVGIRNSFPNRSAEWDHLGVEMCDTNIRLVTLNAGHFSILGNADLIAHLGRRW